MRWMVIVPVMLLCAAAQSFADEAGRLHAAATVLQELRTTPDKDVPNDLWEKAECVAVIPNVKKAAFMVGGEYGRGVMSCRNHGRWSAPMFMRLEKGSWGFQAGAESIDVVLLVMNRGGVEKLLNNKVSLGADASAAAGPIGRSANAATDAQMKAEILSYSRAQGVFAGIDLSGGALRPDTDANKEVYGASATPKEILFGSTVKPPADAASFITGLNRSTQASK
jgi:lipid-binding SYLF domain-containing protein